MWTHWHGHPDVLVGLSVLEGSYLLAVGPLRRRYGLSDQIDSRQIMAFTFGVLVIFLSLLSPIHELSDNYLFSAHMFQHVLLTLVAPPLLIIGTPSWLIRPALRSNWSFRIGKLMTQPVVAFLIFNSMFAIWHLPSLYNLSMINHEVHVAEHLLFIGAAMIMWWPIASNVPELPRLNYPLRIIYLFALSIAQLIVFAPITFSQTVLYEWYDHSPRLWNFPALTDQQVGGIIMKIGGGVFFLTLIIVIFFRWYKTEAVSDKEDRVEKELVDLDENQKRISSAREI